jgi:4-alpha-glucanotransferase/alpha-amylase
MHKRMLQLSARYHALPEAKRTTAMRNELYDAQANDAYWHGLFGGLYLPHLRRAVYNALVRLEALLDRAAPRPAQSREDFNLDGVEEVFLHNAKVQVIVPLDGHASVGDFDARALAHNFGDSLCRQTEHYYRKLNMQDIEQHAKNHDGIASAHDRVAFKHEIFPEDLEVDSEPRALFVDRLNDITQSGYAVQPGPEDSLCFTGNDITKTLTLQRQGIRVGWHFGPLATGTFSTRLNIAMPSCDGPAGRFVFMGNVPGGFGQTLDIPVMQEITLDDDVLGGSLVLRTSHPVHLHAIPHFSVSQSEAGFEKIMQAVTLTLSWPAAVGEMEVSLEVSKHGGAVG